MSAKTKVVAQDGGYAATCHCGFTSWFGGTGARAAARTLAKNHGAVCVEPYSEALAGAAARWHKAKKAERAAMAGLYAAISKAADEGLSEVAIARQAGCDRMTVRRALGKGR